MQYQECHKLKWQYDISPIWFPSEKIHSKTMKEDRALIPSTGGMEQNDKSSYSTHSSTSWDEPDCGIELLDADVLPPSSAIGTTHGLVRRGAEKKPAAMMDIPIVDDIDVSKRRRHQHPHQHRRQRRNAPALDRITSAASSDSDSFSFPLLATGRGRAISCSAEREMMRTRDALRHG